MEILCSHQDTVKDDTHPGLLRCTKCDARFFKEDLIYWKQPWHLPKGWFKDTLKYMGIISGTVLVAILVKEVILNLI